MTDGSFYFNCIKKFMNIHTINKGKAPVIRTLQEMVRALIDSSYEICKLNLYR